MFSVQQRVDEVGGGDYLQTTMAVTGEGGGHR